MSTKQKQLVAAVAAPPAYLLQVFLSMLQTGGSFIDFLRPVMPFFSQIIAFFGNLLIPLGEFFGTMLDAPLAALSEAIPNRDWTGYAPYIVVFAAIFIVAMYFNVVWRPLGYATADSRAKRDAKEARWAEKEAAKEEARAKRKAAKHKPMDEAPVPAEPQGLAPSQAVPSSPAPETAEPGGSTSDITAGSSTPEKNKAASNKTEESRVEEFVDEGKGPI